MERTVEDMFNFRLLKQLQMVSCLFTFYLFTFLYKCLFIFLGPVLNHVQQVAHDQVQVPDEEDRGIKVVTCLFTKSDSCLFTFFLYYSLALEISSSTPFWLARPVLTETGTQLWHVLWPF